MIEFLFEVSGRIARAIEAMGNGGNTHFTTLSLIALGGLLAGISPGGITGAMAALGQLRPGERRTSQNHGLMIAGAFSLGMTAALAVLGLAAAWLGRVLIGYGLAKWLPLLTLVVGLNMLRVIRWNWLRCFSGGDPAASGPGDAFWMGIPFGLGSSPCVLPILIAVLTVAAAKGNTMFGIAGLLAFALGRSVPVLLLGLFSDQVSALPAIRRVSPHLRKVTGGLITAFSLYFLTLGRDLLG